MYPSQKALSRRGNYHRIDSSTLLAHKSQLEENWGAGDIYLTSYVSCATTPKPFSAAEPPQKDQQRLKEDNLFELLLY